MITLSVRLQEMITMCTDTTAEKILELVRVLPDDSALEVLDFAAFLQSRINHNHDETAYLMREPANKERLLQSIENIKSGNNIQQHELLPDD